MSMTLGPRRGKVFTAAERIAEKGFALDAAERSAREQFDLVYRSLCALMFNFVPQSGHPGGSISSGRIVQSLLFGTMRYDAGDPEAPRSDLISYAAGHKALGLYAMWALRDEVMRAAAPDMLPEALRHRLRLEDLLGFRRNPTNLGPLAHEYSSKALDGHPTPATPFVRLSTGASGVGVASSFGLALGARDYWGEDAPRVHVIEGEGGMTPGRVAEALAAAATMGLDNIVMHIDWNQASIDSNKVCRDGEEPGDYVQWNPVELCALNDWNVILVEDGFDFDEIAAAQRAACEMNNGQPTAIVYKTVKGWQYGIEGRASHGAGHALCSEPFYQALMPLTGELKLQLPTCDDKKTPCRAGADRDVVERCYWDALETVRSVFDQNGELAAFFAGRLRDAHSALDEHAGEPRDNAPDVDALFDAKHDPHETPGSLRYEIGSKVALRAALGEALGHLNEDSGGAILTAAADLLGSTSVNVIAKPFGEGFYHAKSNPASRTLSIGGICEDAMTGIFSGVAAYGKHMPAGSSYGAFIAALGHIAARLHGIGSQARQEVEEGPYPTWVLINAHAGLKTGEDGPTHADPQPLQLLQNNFPSGVMISATPWEPQEVWPLVTASLATRPAVFAPFVTRPAEPVLDREGLGLAPASAAAQGFYELVAPSADKEVDATVVLQGSEVTYDFVSGALPKLREDGLNVQAFYVASAELFDAQDEATREAVYPEALAQRAMGITGFTLPTMQRWVRSGLGLEHTLHPFKNIGYPGSGHGASVLAQAGLDGQAQYEAIRAFAAARKGASVI